MTRKCSNKPKLSAFLSSAFIASALLFAAGSASVYGEEASGEADSIKVVEQQFVRVNVNTATVEDLIALKGVGQKKAAAIVQYRKTHGKFKSVGQLTNVTGISHSILDKNRDAISL